MDEHDEDVVDAASEVADRDNGRREFLKKAAVVGGLAAYASPALQIIRMPLAGAQAVNGSIVDPPPPPPPPPPTCTLTISLAGVSCAEQGVAWYTLAATPSDGCSCDTIEWFAFQNGVLVDGGVGPPGQQFVTGIPNTETDPISVYAECNGARSNTINVVAAEDCPPPPAVCGLSISPAEDPRCGSVSTIYTLTATPSDGCNCDNINWFVGGLLYNPFPPINQFTREFEIPNIATQPVAIYAVCTANGDPQAQSNTINVLPSQDCT